ncbi:MAG: hypothetical protein PHS32_11170 [Rhodoferax sp.]|uniref:hypothetical protein n=1 Tax=Rhodoferax sp. TaxID=50421 RepID=UPI002603CD7B|nr:hypothetical protein [Rhodoferax sp.]MDD5334294.1 hypothetical protein [Rhodoferax sp.]
MARAIQRGPLLVQTSVQPGVSPRASATACDKVGAAAPNSAISSVSHTTKGRRNWAKYGSGGISSKRVEGGE